MNITYGVVNTNLKKTSLRVIITHKGKVYRKSIGISVDNSTWSKSKQKSGNVATDHQLKLIRIGLESLLEPNSTPEDIERALSHIKGGTWMDEPEDTKKASVPTFWEYYKEWSERECTSKRQHQLAYRTVRRLMGDRYGWKDLDDTFYFILCKKMQKEGYAPNYQGNIIQRTKTVISEGYKMKYHSNDSYKSWKRTKEESFSVVLTPQEMQMMWDADLRGHDARVRDLAWLGYLTASRYSDYSRLSESNVVGDRLTFYQRKTDNPVLIPCSPKVITIFERNGGKAPKMAQPVFNRDLKEVCRKVGIDSIVQVPMSKRKIMKVEKDEPIYKYMLVSSHTLRRSGASALYKSGVPARVVRFLTGHTSDKQLFTYIKVGIEEGADMLAMSEFFK